MFPNLSYTLRMFLSTSSTLKAIPPTFYISKVKCLSTMRETWVRSLSWEDSLEKETATHSSTLALKISWTEELGAGYCPWGLRVGHD